MTDIVDSATRSRMMSGIRGKDTIPELLVRRFLHAEKFRYRLHVRALPGSPDIVLPRWKTVIFIHGCFWHRHPECRFAYIPKTRQEFWLEKFEKNVARDATAISALKRMGWRVIVIWECSLQTKTRGHVLVRLAKSIKTE